MIELAMAGANESDGRVAAVVTRFAQAAETRDVAAITATLAPQAVQHVRMGEAWSAVPTEQYLSLVREGKIGGEPVMVDSTPSGAGSRAVARAHL
jgi:hypothetical protein